jgi:tetratricopeptide (TPR) repeat protein
LGEIALLAQRGRIEEARNRVEVAVSSVPSDALLGMAAMLASRVGDATAAARYLDALHARQPEDRATRFNLANALIATGRFERVAGLLDGLTREPRIDRLAGFAALQLGDASQARARYRDVLAVWADDADSWANLAQAELALGDGEAAISALEQAITHRRDDVRFYLALIHVLEKLDRPVERRHVARDAAAIRGDDPQVQLALGLAESALDDPVAAEAALRRALALAPDHPAAYLELGLLLESRNRLDSLDALIAAARPFLGDEIALLEAWSAFRQGRLEEAKARSRLIPATISTHRRTHLQAMITDRLGDAASAFRLFEQMNGAALDNAATVPTESYRAGIIASIDAFRATALVSAAASEPAERTPLFIVGFPRSGTTLLDTIIGRLPGTHIFEEQPFIPIIEQSIGDSGLIPTLDPVNVAELRARYWAMVDAMTPKAATGLAVDKHPLHMARMPLVDRLFPGAPILFVERHPYDVVLSCFMANFRLNRAMRSFTDLHEAALTYDAVFTAWHEAEARLGLNVHRVRYERLVGDPEGELRAALSFIGADFAPDMLDNVAASEARGPVRTASYAQITEPIYQRAVARWQRYAKQLAPVIPILRPWAERMGYES